MTTYVQHIDDDNNHEVMGMVKDIKKELKKERPLTKFSKSDCIEDIVKIALKSENRDKFVQEIIASRKK